MIQNFETKLLNMATSSGGLAISRRCWLAGSCMPTFLMSGTSWPNTAYMSLSVAAHKPLSTLEHFVFLTSLLYGWEEFWSNIIHCNALIPSKNGGEVINFKVFYRYLWCKPQCICHFPRLPSFSIPLTKSIYWGILGGIELHLRHQPNNDLLLDPYFDEQWVVWPIQLSLKSFLTFWSNFINWHWT